MKKHIKDQSSLYNEKGVSRRHFVKITGIAAVGVSSFGLYGLDSKGISIIQDPADPIAGSPSMVISGV